MTVTLETILDDLEATADGEKIAVGTILDAFANRSLGVLLALLGGLAAIPLIGGLPGAPLILCILILMAIGQSVCAKGGVWAPERVRAIEVDGTTLEKAVRRARPWARRIDMLVKPRLGLLAHGRAARVAITGCATVLALCFLPLSLIPWGVLVPAMAIVAFGLALMGGDGVLALLGYALAALTASIGSVLF